MDFLEDKRAERFCQYVGVNGSHPGDAWNKAYRTDCGLEAEEADYADEAGRLLMEETEIKGRIGQIRAAYSVSGHVTQEMLLSLVERKLMSVAEDEGVGARDRFNLSRTLVTYIEQLRRMRGWDKNEREEGLVITMNRVYPKGYTGKKEETGKKLEFKVKRDDVGVKVQFPGEGEGESVSVVKPRKGRKGRVRRSESESGEGEEA